jgi:UDP-N-acetylmuramate--alanine ligase
MFKKSNKVHLVGIQGVGMSALANMLVDQGLSVSGSDVSHMFKTGKILQKRGVTISDKFSQSNVEGKDIVIYSGSHKGSDNIEVKFAVEQGIKTYLMPEILAELSLNTDLLAVCGCHGKTTTTAICSYIALKLNINPSYYIGAPEFLKGPSGKYDKGKLLILEADEYVDDPQRSGFKPKLSYYKPNYIICTNIDYDHPDIYTDIAEIKRVFANFFSQLRNNGFILINGDNQDLSLITRNSKNKTYSYGFNKNNDFLIREKKSSFSISYKQKQICSLKYRIYGKHNIYNLAASIIFFYLYMPKKFADAVAIAERFEGVSRRMELISNLDKNLLYDDYAHHPNEISAAIEGLKRKHPSHKIAIIYQPHTYSRTQVFETEFVDSLRTADLVIMLPIFGSMRETKKNKITDSKTLVGTAIEIGSRNFIYARNNRDLIETVKKTFKENEKWVYVTMGAGDVNDRHSIILEVLNKR